MLKLIVLSQFLFDVATFLFLYRTLIQSKFKEISKGKELKSSVS